jgi:hypothetical protein
MCFTSEHTVPHLCRIYLSYSMLIKNVILAGVSRLCPDFSLLSVAYVNSQQASGNLGRAVIPDLLNSDLSFTILSRIGSSVTFSGGANVVQSNYDLESLIQILKGQDAVVSMLGITAMAEQKILANAAIAAGVKLFIPSEFGSDTMVCTKHTLQVVADHKV